MTPRRTKLLAAAAAFTALAIGLTACSGSPRPAAAGSASAQDTAKIKAVASTNVWGSVISAVGGDKVDVTSIIHDPSADPHSYETTPADALAAQSAQLTLGNGGGYDDFFAKLAATAANAKKLVAYDIAATGNPNEHVWYSLPSVEKIADQIAVSLGDIQPASKQAFADNATAFKTGIDGLLKKVTNIGTARPGSKVIATEPVAHYLLDSAKITDATPVEFAKAVENQTDVPAAAIEQVKQLLAAKQVNALVNNAQTITPVTQQVVAAAKAAGVPVVDVTETLPADVTDYIAWMSKEVDALSGALNA